MGQQAEAKTYRLPRKGDRVRFWVLEHGKRRPVEVTVRRRHRGDLEFNFDEDGADPGFTRLVRAREMEIL